MVNCTIVHSRNYEVKATTLVICSLEIDSIHLLLVTFIHILRSVGTKNFLLVENEWIRDTKAPA